MIYISNSNNNTFGLIKAFSGTTFDMIVAIYHDKPLNATEY